MEGSSEEVPQAPVLLLGATEADRASVQQPVVVGATVAELERNAGQPAATAAHEEGEQQLPERGVAAKDCPPAPEDAVPEAPQLSAVQVKTPVVSASPPTKAAADALSASPPTKMVTPKISASPPIKTAARTVSASPTTKTTAPVSSASPPARTSAPAVSASPPAGISKMAPLTMDEFPAGSAPAEKEFEEQQDFSSEPLEARFASKDLNRRCSAYNEAAAAMESSPDTAPFATFREHVGTCLAETLPKGQDAALSALAVYLQRCPKIEEQAGEVLTLVRKLIEHKSIDKPKMQQLVPPVLVLVVEICECAAVFKEVTDCLADLENAKKKTQGFFKKQVAFIIKLISQLLSEFGARKVNPKLGYLNVVLKYVTDSDRGIREACYSVLVELTAWMGDISEAIKSMEEPQKKELAKRIAALPEAEKARGQPQRRYRSEQQLPAADGEGPSAEIEDSSAPLDSFDIVEAVDALKKLPKGWCIDKVFSMEKWKEKQEHMQVLTGLLDVSRLAPAEGYAAFVPALQRLLKTESNLPVVTEAAKCAGMMAKGLRRDFDRSARQLLPLALARINDKSVWKPSVLIDRVEQMLWAVPFEFLVDELRPHLGSKSTYVKKEAINLLFRALDLPAVQHTCPDAATKLLADLASSVLPAIDDSDNGVRHEAAKFLVMLAHRNHSCPDVGPLLLDKVPAVRAQSFADEWRKFTTEIPCPLNVEERPSSVGASRGPSRGPSPLRRTAAETAEASGRSRPASPARPMTPRGQMSRQASPAARPASPAGRTASPLKGRQTLAQRAGAPRGEAALQEASAASSAAAAASNPAPECRAGASLSAPADDVESMSVKEMAEELRNLRSAVARLQQDQQEGAETSRIRAPSGGPPSTPRQRQQSAAAAARPMTPQREQRAPAVARTMTPQREQFAAPRAMTPTRELRAPSAGRRFGESPSQPRLSTSSLAASPAPTRRQLGAASPQHRRDSGAMRPGSNEPRLRRNGSAGTLPASHVDGLEFRIDLPKVSKQYRQQKERNLYWGPEQIPADHLAALRDAWKPCIDKHMHRIMFSDKMEEQLVALQSWKFQVTDNFIDVLEVLDMLLKWVTWMLFRTNTQVWKHLLELMSALLEKLRVEGVQLTEREVQVFLPNVLERSGHNITSIRESMVSVLQQTLCLYPRVRVLPWLILGLQSKNRRSVACILQVLGDAIDRQVAWMLSRSSKDLGCLLKAVDDKDAEVRRAAVHAMAVLSQHLDAEAFARVCKSVPASVQQAIRSAASRLLPLPGRDSLEGELQASVQQAEATMVTPRQQREPSAGPREPAPAAAAAPERRVSVQDPRKGVTARPSDSPSPSPEPKPRAARPFVAPSPELPSAAVPPALQALDARTSSSMRDAALGLSQCSGHEEFRLHCTTLKQGMKQLTEADAPLLAESLVSAMKSTFGSSSCSERCKPLVDTLDEFSASRDCLRPLSKDVLRRLLREQLRNLQESGWTRRCEDGAALLRTLNLSCVMLLSGISRPTAFCLLFELGNEGSEVVASSLVVKCIRKLIKGLGSGKEPEKEVTAVLEVVRAYACSGSASGALLEGALEVVDAARNACPAAAELFGQRLEGSNDRLLRDRILANATPSSGKENCPSAGGADGIKDKRTALAPNAIATLNSMA